MFPTEIKSLKTLEIQQLPLPPDIGVIVKVTDPPAITDYEVDGDILHVGEFGITLYLHSQIATILWLAWISL